MEVSELADRFYLGTLAQRVALQKLAIKFRQEGSQEDFDALKATVDEFEELVTAPEPEPTPEPEQSELPDAHIGTTESDITETA